MASLLADLRFALRAIRRSPLFAAVAIVSLALGIGANTAIFTLMDQLMLRQLPVKHPGQLVMLYQEGPHNGSNMGFRMHSYPLYQDFQTKAKMFSEVLARRQLATSVSFGSQTERVETEAVSGNYFSMLGVKPALGRVLNSAEDDRTYGGHPNVVLSHDYWVNRFARDPKVVGQKMLVNSFPFAIVGVAAEGFTGLDPVRSPHIFVPLQMKAQLAPEWPWLQVDDRRTRWVQVFARLQPGYTADTARAQLQPLFRQIREHEATLPGSERWSKFARDRFLAGTIHLESAAGGFSFLRRNFSSALIVLMCMVGLVLLIACANVASLLIARAFARQKEIAVRLSIGASRGQLVRQLLIESLVLALAGGAAGLALAIGLTRGLLSMIPAEGNPLLIRPEPDLRILSFALALTLVTGVLFGLVPAWRASRPDLWTTLKDAMGSIAGGGGSLLLRKGLVAAQVALSFLLLFGSGLFVKSLQNLLNEKSGFRDPQNLVTFQIAPALNGYNNVRTANFYRQLLDEIRAIPGVRAAGTASVALLAGNEWDSYTLVEGHEAKDGEDMQAFMNSLSPGYFETMGIRLIEGRDFAPRDFQESADPAAPSVVIVNRRFAEHFFKGRSALGRRVGSRREALNREIIGVVEDSLYEGPREGVRRQVFVPKSGNGGTAVYVRGAIGSAQLYPALRAAVQRLDASMPVYDLKTLSAQLDETLLTERLIALLSAGFGLLATLLAAIGLYGVMAFVVTRRTREIGIRMALGAPTGSVLWMVMREVALLSAIGLALGIPAALALGRYVSSQLYGIQGQDPWMAGAATLVLVTVAACAGLIPARRASRIDPMLALRYE